MGDTVICPRIIWKVDLSNLSSASKSYYQSVQVLKSCWKLTIEIDEEWEEYKISIVPESPDMYLNVRFFVQCGVRDVFGSCRFERFQAVTAEKLQTSCIWGARIGLLSDENLLMDNILWFVCTVEPGPTWEDYQILTEKCTTSSPCTSLPCTDTDHLACDLEYLYIHSLHYDVTLMCEDQIIKAHKNVLSCRSRMFEGMFRSNSKEASEGKVNIRDTPFHIFEKMIRYVYTMKIHFEDIDSACKVYVEADKYFIASLKEKCKTYFKAHLCSSCPTKELGSRVVDACKILCLADKYVDVSLRDWAENYLADSALLSTREWKDFERNNSDKAIKVYFKLLKNVNKSTSSFS